MTRHLRFQDLEEAGVTRDRGYRPAPGGGAHFFRSATVNDLEQQGRPNRQSCTAVTEAG